uniref:Putative secreted protein n=1 Tax=Ixodes ricinus TaxID=34613 RepID=A0A6B0UR88_IXORI
MWPEWQLVGVLLSLWAAPYPQEAAKALTWCALLQLVCVIEYHSSRNDMEKSTTHATPLPDTISATHSKRVFHTGRGYEKKDKHSLYHQIQTQPTALAKLLICSKKAAATNFLIKKMLMGKDKGTLTRC